MLTNYSFAANQVYDYYVIYSTTGLKSIETINQSDYITNSCFRQSEDKPPIEWIWR